jgi:cytoplasmic tRNA 2-thiolation protein 2
MLIQFFRTCFFPLVQTRFRKSLEPSINPNPDGPRRKALKAAGSLVIGLSGGTSSITVLDLVAKSYFAPRSTADGATEKWKGGKEHPRNADKGVWKGTAAVGYVEVCGAFPEVRFCPGLRVTFC